MMQLKDRIANGMLFYEHGHKDPVDIEQEQELDALRRHCKEVMFDYNHTRPEDRKKRQELLKGLLGKCGDSVFIEDGVHMSYGCHLYLEGGFYANFNLSVIDDGDIFIGDKTMSGPNVLMKCKFETVGDDKTIEVLKGFLEKKLCTGNIGDGKIFVEKVADVIRVRTGQRGEEAL